MIARFEEIQKFAEDLFSGAQVGAETIQFSLSEQSEKHYYQKSASGRIRASLLGSEPEYEKLGTMRGMAAWAVILSVDMRQSSARAVRVGAEHTYLTMHTYLPTMIELVARANGLIVGLRGDGLFAAFGLTERKDRHASGDVPESVSNTAIYAATDCGKAMIETIVEIISPLLVKNGIAGNLEIGVGIDVGDVVVTRIGLHDVNEVTAYGHPVNRACKLKGANEVILTKAAKRIYPKSEGGRMQFSHCGGDAYRLEYPEDMIVLEKDESQYRPRGAK